jgi:hypothetical protein
MSRTRTVLASLLVLVSLGAGIGCKGAPPPPAQPTLSDEERRTAEKLIAEGKAKAAELDGARAKAVFGPPPTQLAPSPSEACPVDGKKLLPEPLAPDATTNAKRAFSALLLTTTLQLADVVDLDGSRAANATKKTASAFAAAVDPHEKALKEGLSYGTTGSTFLVELQRTVAKFETAYDVVFVTHAREEAELVEKTITPGRIAGRFYLFSRAERRVVCVADVDVIGPRGFIAFGENTSDVAANAAQQLPHRLTGEAVIEGLLTMRSALTPSEQPAEKAGRK